VERRRGERFKLVLPVQLNNGIGTTRDISTSGIFFETQVVHSVGDPIRLSVDFGDTMIGCEGRIVRLEKLNGKSAVAVELTSYEFQQKIEEE
jgi:PilZ domain-containing protein